MANGERPRNGPLPTRHSPLTIRLFRHSPLPRLDQNHRQTHYPASDFGVPRAKDWEKSMALVTGDEFTKAVLKRYEDIPNPRLREVMQAAVKHLHAFVSEVRPTGEEWFKAIQYLTAIGQKC